eukprot:CAMPEP_0185208092 /NCGR_PEP_ID=MMETSP1140-20130426/61444_1 /TAXON_ID=298111 /ORGANISM="Pavlova sp., Strain CCMP459" /LENGTH=92 /DNA_ID=CAMNT_0027775807 /DNA_START=422 /DNA_END=696 /DNA_ORIENTATION=+
MRTSQYSGGGVLHEADYKCPPSRQCVTRPIEHATILADRGELAWEAEQGSEPRVYATLPKSANVTTYTSIGGLAPQDHAAEGKRVYCTVYER